MAASAAIHPMRSSTAPDFIIVMRITRILGSIALWLAALLGIAAGGIWVAGKFGHLQPMVVISGSMEPEIMTGDLLLDRSIATDQVRIGDVLSLPSSHTGKLVTHRVTAITQTSSGWEIRMQGDDNADEDLEAYVVGDTVWTPWVRIPQGGKVVSKAMELAVAMPIIVALVALLGISLLDEPKRQVVRRVIRLGRSDPRVDELDEQLAAVGVDVEPLRAMSDLDLQLYALGIDPDPDQRGGLWGMQLPPSDGIEHVRPPLYPRDTRDTREHLHDEHASAGHDHREPSLSG